MRCLLFLSLSLAACSPAYAGTWGCVAASTGVAILACVTLLAFVFAGGFVYDAKTRWPDYVPAWIFFAMTVLMILLAMPRVCSADIPDAAMKYRRDLVRIAHTEMGLDAPIATLAAQVHQESRWNEKARSPVGAVGLVQIMPGTAEWLARLRQDLAAPQPLNPLWNLRAAVIYDVWLLDRVQARGSCDKWAMAMAAYNGGLGWVIKDQRLASAKGADPRAWFNSVERYNSGRSASNFKENRHYASVILLRWEPLYEAADWGNGVCS